MKILLIALLLLCSKINFAQVYKFKAFQAKYIDIENKRNSTDWEDRNILVVLNTEKGNLRIYTKEEQEYDLVFKSNKNDDNEDTWLTYKGVDENGKRSVISFILYKDQTGKHNATLTVQYKDVEYYYRLTMNN